MGCSPWRHKELDTIEQLTQHRFPEHIMGFPSGSAIENPPDNAGDMGSVPGWGKSLGEGNGSPLQILAWEITWTEEPGGLLFMGLQRVGHDLTTKQQQQHILLYTLITQKYIAIITKVVH